MKRTKIALLLAAAVLFGGPAGADAAADRPDVVGRLLTDEVGAPPGAETVVGQACVDGVRYDFVIQTNGWGAGVIGSCHIGVNRVIWYRYL